MLEKVRTPADLDRGEACDAAPAGAARLDRRRLDDAVDLLNGWLWEMGADLRFSYFTESVRKHAGKPPEWHYGKRRDEVGVIDMSAEEWVRHFKQLHDRLPFDPIEFYRYESGRRIWIRTVGKPVFDAGGEFCGYRGVAFDVTAEKEAEQTLADTRKFLDLILENVPVAILVKDPLTRKILFVNQAYEEFIGLPRDQVLGRTVFDFYPPKVAEAIDRFDSDALRAEQKVAASDITLELPAHGQRVVNATRLIVRDKQGEARYLIVATEDVTEKRKAERHMATLAYHDALTGLPNRAVFLRRLEEAAARHRRWGEPFSVFLMDLDRFKLVNDTYGHPAGDALLKQVAERLKSSLRRTDVLARLGGDEFAVIQPNETNQRGAAESLAGRIAGIVAEPFLIDGNELTVGVSVGIAFAPEHAIEPGKLLKMADLALYRSKTTGRNGFRCFEPEMWEAASARRELENDLRSAFAENALRLHYQPIVDTRTLRLCCAEASIEWHHPHKGVILPSEFIPVAEDSGLMIQIGEWALRRACAEAATWPAFVKVAVNLSPVQLHQPNLAETVMGALAASGLSPRRLELEVTEAALMENATECLPLLRRLKALDVTITLDHFGTGYSSLSQLTTFPFDKIKIDQSLTANMTKRADCAAIISSVLTLARCLDIATTAEGIGSRRQFELLGAAGATSLQGSWLGHPGPAAGLDFSGTYGARAATDAA
jgi:diguanylate cyclase (GGDEF)-like protein/PAS domain S-box-containing protein